MSLLLSELGLHPLQGAGDPRLWEKRVFLGAMSQPEWVVVAALLVFQKVLLIFY